MHIQLCFLNINVDEIQLKRATDRLCLVWGSSQHCHNCKKKGWLSGTYMMTDRLTEPAFDNVRVG